MSRFRLELAAPADDADLRHILAATPMQGTIEVSFRREPSYFDAALMDRHYAGMSREAFDADLAEKPWVIEVRHPSSGELCGFSTQMLIEMTVARRPIRALFSGDTIIDRRYWGDQALTHVWGRLALALIDALPATELYWFLISQGYKTYRFLPVFFHEFCPRCRQAPAAGSFGELGCAETLAALASERYCASYDAESGIIRADRRHYRLREGVAEATPERLHDPHVRFFVHRNPQHAQGDELCCLAPLTRMNLTPAAYRVIGQGPQSATLARELRAAMRCVAGQREAVSLCPGP